MRYLLFLLSIIYGCVMVIRNLLFDYGVFKSYSYNIPIICIGNLSAGGTGKTPHIQHIITILKDKFNIAILSRGYGRDNSNLQYVNTSSNVQSVGDEPLQIKKNNPECLVLVEKNRNKGVKDIIKNHPQTEIILLDDGFQHRWLQAGLNIIITTFASPYYEDHHMPLGALRESRTEAARADVIIFSKSPNNIDSIKRDKMIKKLSLSEHQQAYFSNIEYSYIKSIKNNEQVNELHKKSITLVTGIANPNYLIQYLKEEGHNINHIKYSDHYNYNDNDITNILEQYNKDISTDKIILTTEKDAVKLRNYKDILDTANVYYICIEINFEQKQKFEKQILDYVNQN